MPRDKAIASAALVPITVLLAVAADVIDLYVFVATGEYELVGVSEVHDAAGTDGGAVTLDVKRCASGGANPAAGTSLLASTFNLKSTADTPVRKTVANGGIAQTLPGRLISDGQILAIDITGVTTAIAGMAITFWLKPTSRRSF